MDYKTIDKKFCPIPFWSWNEKLNKEETTEQVVLMDEAGIGGFFMHARGGLSTPYLGKEWFENVAAAVEEGDRRGMHSWAYDENGWPSGFGGGIVNGMGEKYQQKYLRMSVEEPKEHVLGKNGDHWFYYEINPFYVDTLDEHVTEEFLKVAYEPYYEKFGNRIKGFFTDEPQISRNGIPWSLVFEEEYKKRYGKNLLHHLEELFLSVGEYRKTRIQFWKMVTDLFSKSFCGKIYDWCHEHGMELTGHLVLEETLESQLTTNGACMPHYEYFDMPGMDWLGRKIYPCLTPLQVSSVAEQLGKEDVLSETFALCGHNVSFAEMKGIYEWQMVHGINRLCQHLQGYSLRGIRKRDYPPAMYYQQPWWEGYREFLNPLSRAGMLLSRGKKKVDILLIHPQTTAWSLFDCGENKGLAELNAAFMKQIQTLERKHVLFHLGDETIMERHGYVDGNQLCIGQQKYKKVIASCGDCHLAGTIELLDQFEKNGGIICSADEIEDTGICMNPEISYTRRILPEGILHYFVNSSPEEKTVKLGVKGYLLDMEDGEKKPLKQEYTFEPWGSLMVLEDEEAAADDTADGDTAQRTRIEAGGMYRIRECSENILTLDFCDYYFDGVLQETNGYVLNIAERAIALERLVKIRMDYHVKMNAVPEKLFLICEVPEQYTFAINGRNIKPEDTGYFLDKSFRRLDVSGYFEKGENTITLLCDFVQSPEFYEKMRRAKIFESEKNMLAYDMEIEAVYLTGDFGVETPGQWTELERRAVRYHGDFVIGKRPEVISAEHIEQQGFPFFAGKMVLEKEVELPDSAGILRMERCGINIVEAELGGCKKKLLTKQEMKVDETGGIWPLKLTLINNLRNMLGPHHLKEGETYAAGPNSFYKETCVWKEEGDINWDNDYCFAEMGLIIK